MTIFKKNMFVLGFTFLGFSALLIIFTIAFINSPALLILFLCVYFAVLFFVIYKFSKSLSASFRRLAKIVQFGASLLPENEIAESAPTDIKSLEKAMKVITKEVTNRLGQAQSERSRLEAILNGMSEAVFAMDSSLKLHLVNPKARELFNLGSSDVGAKTLLEATRSTVLVDIVKKAINAGTPLETELTFRFGAEQHFLVYATPLNNNVGVVLVLQDVTRLVKLERVRKDFVANVSHELRTPIQLIKGFSETLLDSVKGKQDKHFIEIIHKNAGTMENLTNDLLILADLENNAVNTRDLEELSIAALINEVVFSVEPKANKKNIEIITDCKEDLSVKLYGSLIIQALINLADNSIKYSKEKSKIWVSAFTENQELIFEVRDKGAGISSEHLGRIFERFYRVDRARSRDDQQSTGLGLSIVRHIALLHKGNAEVESHVGEGSVFRIKIPILN